MSILKKTALTLLISILAIPGLNAARSGYTSTALRATRTQTLLNALKYYGGHALAFLLPAGGTYKALKGVTTPQSLRRNAQATINYYQSLQDRGLMPSSKPLTRTTVSIGKDQAGGYVNVQHGQYQSPSFIHARDTILNAYDIAKMSDAQLQCRITTQTSATAALVGLTCMMLYNWYYETQS